MENIRLLKCVVIAFIIPAFIMSCEESTDIMTENISVEKLSQGEKVNYAEKHLKEIARGVAIANTKEFRSSLYSEIENKKFGDYNVLLEELLEKGKNETFASRIKANNSSDFDLSLNAFKEIEGLDYYPQVYIPFYEELQKATEEKKVLTVESSPSIIFHIMDTGQKEYPEYKITSKGELIETGKMINETYASENEVWIFSLNENFELSKEGLKVYNNKNLNSRLLSASAIIDKIKCKCHKESWSAGASEVHIITIVSDYEFYNLDINLYGGGQNEGGQIYKFSRSDVKNQSNKDVHFYIINDWDDRAPDKPYGNYVIFEYDTWPTGKKTASWTQGGATLSWEYRSADGYYDKQTVYKTGFASHSVNNSCIEWSAQYQ
jgi:hypothetical protein